MQNRREWLGLTLGAGAALSLPMRRLEAMLAQGARAIITRPIPSSGERIPAIGLGSSATFSQVARSEDVTALKGVPLQDGGARRQSLRYRAGLRRLGAGGRRDRPGARDRRQGILGDQAQRGARRRGRSRRGAGPGRDLIHAGRARR